jgi:integrase
VSQKKPETTLQYSTWRKDRHGIYQPYARYKSKELKMKEYTFDEVARCRQVLKDLEVITNNKRQHGAATDKNLTPFQDFYNEWIKYKRKIVAKKTLDTYKVIAETHILPKLKEKLLPDITRKDIEDLIDQVYASGKKRTAQLCHNILSNFFTFCLNENFLDKSPFTKITYPKHLAEEKKVLSPTQAKQFIKLTRKTKHGLMFELALITGMRPEEYFALQWDHIDFTHNLISVRKALDLKNKEITFHELKSKNSRRQIPLSGVIIKKLKAHQKKQKQIKYEYKFNLVFCAENGKPLNIGNINKRHFEPIVDKIDKDKNLSLYSLRHTCATLLMLAGENPKVVAERLGNSVSVTLKTYSHVSPNMQKTASEKLEAMFK